MTAEPMPCWTKVEIDAEIERLEHFLNVLPEEHEGTWSTTRIHREISAQLGVLRTGRMNADGYATDTGDAAGWAEQWLYDGKACEAPPTGMSEEWKFFVGLCAREPQP